MGAILGRLGAILGRKGAILVMQEAILEMRYNLCYSSFKSSADMITA
jgi:hypothetical protein